MSRVIVYSRPDGGVSVVHPSYGDRLRPNGDTDEALIARCFAALPPDSIDAAVIDKAALPTARTFRTAWKRNGEAVDVDMTKARQHWLDAVIRPARDAELAKLDIEALRAIEADDRADLARIAAQKQALRDLPDTIKSTLDAAATPEDLEAVRVDSVSTPSGAANGALRPA